jgi:hypothetical protein
MGWLNQEVDDVKQKKGASETELKRAQVNLKVIQNPNEIHKKSLKNKNIFSHTPMKLYKWKKIKKRNTLKMKNYQKKSAWKIKN